MLALDNFGPEMKENCPLLSNMNVFKENLIDILLFVFFDHTPAFEMFIKFFSIKNGSAHFL